MFKNILVGVDLGQLRPASLAALNPLTRDIIDRSIWLAEACSAKIRFFAAFNASEETLHGLDSRDHSQLMLSLEEKAVRILGEIAGLARARGLDASWGYSLGKAWLEIIRAVLKGRHDLAMVGTRDRSGFRRMLLGNTALKLMRRCPCPVWVVKPGMSFSALNILVAADLKAASLAALSTGIELARLTGANLHILHAVEYPLDRLSFVDVETELTDRYHWRLRQEAERRLLDLLGPMRVADLGPRCRIHLEDGIGSPDITIQSYLQTHRVDLLIMGTIGRHGLSGVLIGNTAERLLPEIDCSVLAVKPPDFQCPIHLEHQG